MEEQNKKKAVFYYQKGTLPNKNLVNSYTKVAADYGIPTLTLEACEFRYPGFMQGAFKIFEEKKELCEILNSEDGKSFHIFHNNSLMPNGDRTELLLTVKDDSQQVKYRIKVIIANLYADGRSWQHVPEDLFSFMLDCGLIATRKKLNSNNFSDIEVNLTNLIYGKEDFMTPEEIIRFLA